MYQTAIEMMLTMSKEEFDANANAGAVCLFSCVCSYGCDERAGCICDVCVCVRTRGCRLKRIPSPYYLSSHQGVDDSTKKPATKGVVYIRWHLPLLFYFLSCFYFCDAYMLCFAHSFSLFLIAFSYIYLFLSFSCSCSLSPSLQGVVGTSRISLYLCRSWRGGR